MSDTFQRDAVETAPLQELAAERLAAHRMRRYGFELPTDAVVATPSEAMAQERLGLPAGASRVREVVAERYKHSVSYREFLAAEAERAVAQAQAQVEVATRNVAAVAAAQTKLMEELQLWPAEPMGTDAVAMYGMAAGPGAMHGGLPSVTAAATPMPSVYPPRVQPPGLRVRLHEPMRGSVAVLPRPVEAEEREDAVEEIESLDEEIAFRAAPEFEEHLLEPLTIQPNILEFPRQLVAARRVRPRLAEGPLADGRATQLRIFEVEMAAVSVVPVADAAAEWQSVMLDAPVRERAALPVSAAAMVRPELKHMAPFGLRFIALVVDACWVGLLFVGAVCGVAKVMGPTLPHFTVMQLAVGAVAGLLTLGLVYGLLFVTLAGATLGMMYAEIGLYKFDTTDPKRSTLRVWMLLTLLSALPAGVGLLWAVVDRDGLGWQDRVCKVYPRLV